MAFVIINLVCVAALVGADQLIKLWAVRALAPVGAMPLIPHLVELRFVLNQGMAFSLLSGKQLFLIVATSAATAARLKSTNAISYLVSAIKNGAPRSRERRPFYKTDLY